MINEEIMKRLRSITEEEKYALNSGGRVDTDIYMSRDDAVVDSKKLLNKGKLITVRTHTRFVHFPEHTHNYIEAVYMCSGETVHIINGDKVTLRTGELLFLSRGARQEIMPASEDDIAVNFIIQPEFFDSDAVAFIDEGSPLRSFLLDCMRTDDNSTGYIHFNASNILPVQNLVENLIWSLMQRVSGKRKINQMTMALIFMHLANHTEKINYSDKQNEAAFKALRYIEENYKEGSLSQLSKELHYDFAWYSREIKRRTGFTYTELVQKKRLSQAAFLLSKTDMSVEDIALNVGYENASYFYRLFKKEYKLSPRNYRINCK